MEQESCRCPFCDRPARVGRASAEVVCLYCRHCPEPHGGGPICWEPAAWFLARNRERYPLSLAAWQDCKTRRLGTPGSPIRAEDIEGGRASPGP